MVSKSHLKDYKKYSHGWVDGCKSGFKDCRKYNHGWVDGCKSGFKDCKKYSFWVSGWADVNVVLRIAYSVQKSSKYLPYLDIYCRIACRQPS